MVHTRNKKLASDVDLHEIAKITPMFTGADIENLMNEAAILAAKRNKDEITMEEVRESIYKVAMGPERKAELYPMRKENLPLIMNRVMLLP